MTALRVAVDFGTSSTCIAVSVHGREPQVVTVDGHPLMSSAVYAAPDATLFVGQEADRQAAIDPSRYEPHPKRRIDEPELLLGSAVIAVRDVVRAVLTRAISEARRVAGGAAVDQLVLTHPADWGGIRTRVLRQSANGLASRIVLVPEPVAAAVFHAASFPPASGVSDGVPAGAPPKALAVLDIGGGTVDVSVVRRTAGASYQVLATRGDPTFGGADIDQLLLEHVGTLASTSSAEDASAWRALIEGRELPDRRRRRVIHQDVRGAKETLSRHTYTDVPLPPPFPDAHVTRADLERLVAGQLGRAADLTEATIRAAGLTPAQLTGIFLVGGSSRIPLIARLIHQRCGIVPTTLDQPETVVARGALRAVGPDPAGTGVVAARAVADLATPDLTVLDTGGPPGRRPPPRRPGVPLTTSAQRPVPPPPPARPTSRRPALIITGAILAAAAVTAVVLVLTSGEATPDRMIAQYEYQFALPTGWTQTGGDPELLRTEIKPVGGEENPDRILVEEKRLAFDSNADRDRALDKLRTDFEGAGPSFTGFDDNATFAGRSVIRYQQRLEQTTADWYVLFESDTQVSIGCQYTDGGRDTVHTACETVVRTMTVIE